MSEEIEWLDEELTNLTVELSEHLKELSSRTGQKLSKGNREDKVDLRPPSRLLLLVITDDKPSSQMISCPGDLWSAAMQHSLFLTGAGTLSWQFGLINDRLSRAKDVLSSYRVELRGVLKEVGKGTYAEYDAKGKEHK